MNMKDKRLLLQSISFLAFGVGLASFFFYPELVAKNTYVSENALMPGSGRIEYDQTHMRSAVKQTAKFHSHAVSINNQLTTNNRNIDEEFNDFEWSSGCASWISKSLQDLGLDTHVYSTNTTNNKTGIVISGILRAGKGDGTEGIVLSSFFTIHSSVQFTRVNIPLSLSPEAAGGVGILLSIAEFLRSKKWLAKDIIFVVADSSESISYWLRDYHQGNLPQWGGALQAALHIGLRPWPISADNKDGFRRHEDSILVHIDGSNGQLPNLDMVNTLVHFTKVYHLRASISLPLHPVGPFIDHCIKTIGLPASQYQESKSLLAFMARQAVGVPDDSNGPHPYFNMYNIDALSIDVDRDAMGQYETGSSLVIPVLVLGTIRSLNNLLEHLHQSFYYYLLYRPNRYVSIGNYMVSLALLLAPMFVYILFGLHWLSGGRSQDILSGTATDLIVRRDIPSREAPTPRAIVVNAIASIVLHISGIAMYGIPIMLGISNNVLLPLLVLVAIFSLSVIYFTPVNLKIFLLFATIPTIVFIASMSLLNFSFCVFAAAFVVPIYTLILHTHHRMNVAMQLFLLAIPPSLLFTICNLGNTSPGLIFEIAMNHHLEHGTLLFPFLTLVRF